LETAAAGTFHAKVLHRVTLKFPTDAQMRYLEHVPGPGERIRGLADESFVVAHVKRDGGGFVVTCVPAAEPTIRETQT
jgi:hypothetical protein